MPRPTETIPALHLATRSRSIQPASTLLEALEALERGTGALTPVHQWCVLVSLLGRSERLPSAEVYSRFSRLVAQSLGLRGAEEVRRKVVESGGAEVVLVGLGKYGAVREVVGWGLGALGVLATVREGRVALGQLGTGGLVLGKMRRFGKDLWIVQKALVALGNLVVGDEELKHMMGKAGVVEAVGEVVGRLGVTDVGVAWRGMSALRNLCCGSTENAARVVESGELPSLLNVTKKWRKVEAVQQQGVSFLANLVGAASSSLRNEHVEEIASALALIAQYFFEEPQEVENEKAPTLPKESNLTKAQKDSAASTLVILRLLTNADQKDLTLGNHPTIVSLPLRILGEPQVFEPAIQKQACYCLFNLSKLNSSLNGIHPPPGAVTTLLNILELSSLSEDLVEVIFELLTYFVQCEEKCLKQALSEDSISLISQMLQINCHNPRIYECGCRLLRILVSGRSIIPGIQEDRIPLEFEAAGKVALFALRGYPEREELERDALKILSTIGRTQCLDLGADLVVERVLSRKRLSKKEAHEGNEDDITVLGTSLLRQLARIPCSFPDSGNDFMGSDFEVGQNSQKATNDKFTFASYDQRRRKQRGRTLSAPPLRKETKKNTKHVRFDDHPIIRTI